MLSWPLQPDMNSPHYELFTVIIICPHIWQLVIVSLRFLWKQIPYQASLSNEEIHYLM